MYYSDSDHRTEPPPRRNLTHRTGGSDTARVSSETRPRNLAVLYIIKAK
jgi:hypothetical protein